MEEKIRKREVAYKCSVASLLNGEFLRQEGWEPSYILTKEGQRVSRANLLGMVIVKQEEEKYTHLLIDDGSSTIAIKNFDTIPEKVRQGQLINIIGRVREHNQEIFINAECIKEVNNPKWREVRELELLKQSLEKRETQQETSAKEEIIHEEKIMEEGITKKTPPFTQSDETEQIYTLIKKLDGGTGAAYEEILKESKNEKAEEILSTLLQEGEIFEVSPGKIKVLN